MATQNQTPSLSDVSLDPVRNFKFHVKIYSVMGGDRAHDVDLPYVGFTSVSGLSVVIDSTDYRQAGLNVNTIQMPMQANWTPVTLTAGIVPFEYPLYDWITRVFNVIQGTGGNGNWQDFRSTVDILAVRHPSSTPEAPYAAMWRLYNAWPAGLVYGDLDAGGQGILLQQLTLRHEGFRHYGPWATAAITED